MNEATLDKMRKMKLLGMYRAFKTNLETQTDETYTPDEIIAHLVDAEWDERQHRTVEQKIKNARFRYKAALEDLHYNAGRNIDKNQIMRFADYSFIDKAECILITGSTGIGKSYIASAKVILHRHLGTMPAAWDTKRYTITFPNYLQSLK